MGRKLREGKAAGVAPKLAVLARRLLKREGEDDPEDTLEPADLVPMAEFICSCRRLRDDVFGADFFGDPAWDILLDLYIGQSESRTMPGRTVSWNTTQRWVNVLEAEGLVLHAPGSDRLGGDIRLTEKGASLMHDYLRRAARIV
ncbi:MAG: hypothetical protein J7530_10760 [Novosphingobium sp.]|nr:hypothetical protein [Novosphingobium sp.]